MGAFGWFANYCFVLLAWPAPHPAHLGGAARAYGGSRRALTMKPDRYGEIIKVTASAAPHMPGREVAHLKPDISGKVVRVLLADCTEVWTT